MTPRHEIEILSASAKACGFDTNLAPESWQYEGFRRYDDCSFTEKNCFGYYCKSQPFKTNLFLIDSEREKKINLGRTWELGPLEQGNSSNLQNLNHSNSI